MMVATKRQPHVIKTVQGSRLPSQVIALDAIGDISSSRQKTTMVVARLKDGKAYRAKRESGCFYVAYRTIVDTCRPHTSTWLVARNLYDTLTSIGWFDAMPKLGWSIKRTGKDAVGQIVHEPGCCYVVCKHQNGAKLTMVDAANYGVESLPGWSDNLANNAGLLMTWFLDWIAWIRKNDAGTMRLTLASQAHYCYRKRFMKQEIFVHNNDKALSLEEDCLFGGRCEAFKLGGLNGPIYHLDARSLYGAVAAWADMPSRLVAYADGKLPAEVIGDNLLIADVTVNVDQPAVPCRVKMFIGNNGCDPNNSDPLGKYIPRQDQLVIWPTGTFRTCLCGPELSSVVNNIVKWHRSAAYAPAPLFKEFALWNWDRRQEAQCAGDITLARQLKQWSQFCYGKWAARHRGWEHDKNGHCVKDWELWWEWDRENGHAVPRRAVAGRCERYVDGGLAPGSVPILTAWINSLARGWLWVAMQLAGRENVYYVDTDSLIVNEAGWEYLRQPESGYGNDLGNHRLVGRHKRGYIYGWKHYELDGVVTCAGDHEFRKRQVVDQVPGELAEPLTVAASHGRSPQAGKGRSCWKPFGKYRHGIVQSSGQVIPHHLEYNP